VVEVAVRGKLARYILGPVRSPPHMLAKNGPSTVQMLVGRVLAPGPRLAADNACGAPQQSTQPQ
jgi:hypothetical protein